MCILGKQLGHIDCVKYWIKINDIAEKNIRKKIQTLYNYMVTSVICYRKYRVGHHMMVILYYNYKLSQISATVC